ncbi:hypothetical protein AGLY_005608 [Aphis glycines]|uniref:Protein crumbs n=1 Tax=Aphis glycines TaxID=307491 RepID=A0A6G0TT87_APHGL|nr:hypothetical protein AGLY_005608 [Aphis glycines]
MLHGTNKFYVLFSVNVFIHLICTNTQRPGGAYREGYFNSSSWLNLFPPISLYKHIGFSFRTCSGGQIFSQIQDLPYTRISVDVFHDGLLFTTFLQNKHFESKIQGDFFDNSWHNVNMIYKLGELTISIDGLQQVIANSTFNSEILNSEITTDQSRLRVGDGFEGCLLEGPNFIFNSSLNQAYKVVWGNCPLNNQSCTGTDYCSHAPCMMHGVCVPRQNKYHCICHPRYSGNNCEIDNGSPCLKNNNRCIHGLCEEIKYGEDFICHCDQGFTGKFCEIELSAHVCDNNPCRNNGTCKLTSGGKSYECSCAPGFKGDDCEININECLSSPCQHGGICIDGVNNYTCACSKTGYKGINCETNINECEINPCFNHGVCFDNYGSYTCQCQSGFGGINCEIDLNECISNPCQNGGQCRDKVGAYECRCALGFVGRNCEIDVDDCETAVCPINSICVDGVASHSCHCKSGFTGIPPNCTEITVCSSHPCQNGGSCGVLPNGQFNCSCTSGYTGAFCEHGIIVARSHADDGCKIMPCMNSGTCISQGSNYECKCPTGFTGRNCEMTMTMTMTMKCNSGPCQHFVSCHDYAGGYYCECEPGWSGQQCNQRDPGHACSPNTCAHGGICIPLGGQADSFRCNCPPGFTGQTCQIDIDECMSTPCLNGGICHDLINGFRCNCTDNYMGAYCQLPYDACTKNPSPCLNNGTCLHKTSSLKDYYCKCSPGFEGKNCEVNINECLMGTCPIGKVCIDGINTYECKCPEGYTGENCSKLLNDCRDRVCKNNSTCSESSDGYTCHCTPGFTGINCDQDINECEVNKEVCNYGICVNTNGSYQCFCRPGFSGDNCDVDFDECLSQPCYNGATCENKINGFNCICPPGYSGKVCNIDVDECNSNPCFNGATCIDNIASFSCSCPIGFTGKLCETDIDDCEVRNHCELNINDCIHNLCENNGTCIDGIKDYSCKCYAGYTGKNCEVDINECESNPCQFGGTCLEHSNISLYNQKDNNNLSAIFQQEFNYATANGFECLCLPGTTGIKCEIDINECESSPCLFGQCENRIGGYICTCEDGYEGVYCEIDINECERFKPCDHGTCIDRRAGYYCDCIPKYGGKNCSVELFGCQGPQPCLNNGTCRPYLFDETEHRYNCTCPYGFHGHICDKTTTMSLTGESRIVVNTTRDEGYDISFRFKTTLPSGLLAIGGGSTFYILELVKGRLNLHSSLLNKWEGVFIGSELNNSQWQKVFVAINSSHLVLSANEEQTIYPINLNEGANPTHTSFPTTYVGGTISNLRLLPHGPPFFIGCIENLLINGQWVLPDDKVGSTIGLTNVDIGCQRDDQCFPNPCHNSGHCTDLWKTFSCTCERPYLGNTCQYSFPAATFGHENITNSLVTVNVYAVAKRAVRNIVDISMFIRTRQTRGAIFYLGSMPGMVTFSEETHIAAELEGGELLVRIQFNATPESYTVGGVKLDDGHNHLIQVVRNITLVQVKINGTEYFRKTISATGQLDVQVLYLGGFPSSKPSRRDLSDPLIVMDNILPRPNTIERHIRQTTADKFDGIPHFKGIIQDVQISNGSQIMVVEFYPLGIENKDLVVPKAFGSVSFNRNEIAQGVLSDNTCRSEPCHNDGVCSVTWNDFTCKCPLGYKGKQCQEMEFCQLQDCPLGSECRNLNHGYECVANITLDSRNTTEPLLQYSFIKGQQVIPLTHIEVSYRTRTGGTIMYVSNKKKISDSEFTFFTMIAYKDRFIIAWKLEKDSSISTKQVHKDHLDSEWTTIVFKLADNKIQGGLVGAIDDTNQFLIAGNFSLSNWIELITSNTILIGRGERYHDIIGNNVEHATYLTDADTNSLDIVDSDSRLNFEDAMQHDVPSVGGFYKGCLGEIRIGGLLLPYFTPSQLNTNNQTDHFVMLSHNSIIEHFDLDCLLCYDSECKNDGRCKKATESYVCECQPGYEADDCSVNINECLSNQCKNGAECIDGIANYTCHCNAGWTGTFCEIDINECESSPCHNNGICIDQLGKFECNCTDDYEGVTCEQLKLITCDNLPCKNGADCFKIPDQFGNNYTCSCLEGFSGSTCDTAFCDINECQNDGLCKKEESPFCECPVGFKGHLCEQNIDDCLDNGNQQKCQHGGQCIDGINEFTCNCTETGYTGDDCSIDIDECFDLNIQCGHRGECKNTPGSFICQCEKGYCGHLCDLNNPCLLENPCQNGGFCQEHCTDVIVYECQCANGYVGQNCTELPIIHNYADIALIVGPILLILLIGGMGSLLVLLMMARKKRATRGTYSPSCQEYCNPRVELDNVLKPPPEERLI